MDVLIRRVLSEQLADSLRRPLPEYTLRRVFGRLSFAGKATAVTGIRRAGKTAFLHGMRRRLLDRGVARERLPYLSFEDERLDGLHGRDLGLVVDEHYRRFPHLRDVGVTWCLDEVQMVAGWERFVRRLLDTERAEVFVTGSSAALLSQEIATALRGRAWQVVMHPFSLEEALRHRGRPIPPEPAFLAPRERSHLERAMLDWLQAGGFPEAQGLDAASRFQLLRDYVDVAVLRDVIDRHAVRNVAGLRALVRHLLGNAGSPFSVEKFHAALKSQGMAIGRDTLHQFLAHLEDCFLVRFVWMESGSERQRMVNPRKAYPVDPGLIPLFDRTGRANLGHALETAVLVELERRRYDVTYVRTPEGYEVDFLARRAGGDAEMIRVCADLSDPATAGRELRALASAGSRFPHARKRLLTLVREGIPGDLPPGVTAQPAYEWLLTPPDDPDV